MIGLKLSVLLIYMIALCRSIADYCKICRNHTLCLYSSTGPGDQCDAYDKTVLLTSAEIFQIVSRINERRNFVAMGLANFLPQAADMKEIIWSQELANFAQRWVDQCDQNIQPDKEDICRDLVNAKVGQNIATILGTTTGLNVKSFVDMWFMPILTYKGNVAYYNDFNQSRKWL
uniref:SCP domain-containing protein n=1 Tax=Bombyx mori TaxID=7091 RepID=A0A8R2QWE1_BOMMO|nr:venom allergen 5 isoform X4 [Bombyx mori]